MLYGIDKTKGISATDVMKETEVELGEQRKRFLFSSFKPLFFPFL